jgi:ABC-type transporter Mla maintaining outer membrane lipid asymmetry permease subunit MlaE
MFFKNLFMNTTEAVTDAVTDAIEAIGGIDGEVVTTVAAAESAFSFNPANFVSNLYYMGVGMLAIFIVIAAIIGMVYALDVLVKAFSLKLPKKQ